MLARVVVFNSSLMDIQSIATAEMLLLLVSQGFRGWDKEGDALI